MYKLGQFGALSVTQGDTADGQQAGICRWAMSPFYKAHATSYSTLIATVHLSCTVFEIQLFVESRPFNPPNLNLASPHGFIPVEFRRNFWRQETTVPGLSSGVVCLILSLAVLVEHRLVTDSVCVCMCMSASVCASACACACVCLGSSAGKSKCRLLSVCQPCLGSWSAKDK